MSRAYMKSHHLLPPLITILVQMMTMILRPCITIQVCTVVATIVMFMNSIHPLPLLVTVGFQVPTVHMVKAIMMFVTVGVQGMTMECMVTQGGTGHHPVTVQWILENLQVEMYVTIHPLQVAALQVLTIMMYGTIYMSILSTVE